MQRVAIAGASGYIGGRLVPRLLERGYVVRCLVRSPGKLQSRSWSENPLAEVCRCDLGDSEALTRDLTGCDAAYYLVHSMNSAGAEYAKRDQELAAVFAKAAKAAGVGRIIYLGGLGETGEDLSEHLSSRRAVEETLASTGVPVTTLRAAMIIGSGSASFEILRYLVERLPVMITPRWVSTPCQPIAIQNVIVYLVEALTAVETAGRVFDIGGPDVLCYRDIMRIMAEELKLPRRWIIPVPFLTPRLSSYWIHLVTPLSHDIARPLAEGLKNPVVCREAQIQAILPQALLGVRGAIRAALDEAAGQDVETTWSMAGVLPGDPDWAGGTVFADERSLEVAAPASAVFRAVCRLGGSNGWYGSAWLWWIRGAMDRLVGGPGMRRGRRNPDKLMFGDALDFWRVAGLERDSRLALRAEMKVPGEAWLEFKVEPLSDNRSKLHQLARFQPRGLFGLIYWYMVLPFHHFVFNGMLRGIAREAEKISHQSRTSAGAAPQTLPS